MIYNWNWFQIVLQILPFHILLKLVSDCSTDASLTYTTETSFRLFYRYFPCIWYTTETGFRLFYKYFPCIWYTTETGFRLFYKYFPFKYNWNWFQLVLQILPFHIQLKLVSDCSTDAPWQCRCRTWHWEACSWQVALWFAIDFFLSFFFLHHSVAGLK